VSLAAAFRGGLFKVSPHDRSAYTFLQVQSMAVKIADHPDQLIPSIQAFGDI
jgi:hypothetical protein